MKILIINTVLTGKNGITNVIFNFLRNIDRKEMTFDYLSINEPEASFRKEIETKGGMLFVLCREKGVVKYWINLIKLLWRNKYDAIHIHCNSHTVTLELSAAWVAGCKNRIVHCHNTTCKYILIHHLLTPFFFLLCTKGLACGKDAGKWMFGKKPFDVINNGIDTEKYVFSQLFRKEIRKSLNLLDETIIIGHVGYFKEVKNQRFIIDIFKDLLKTDNRYYLVLIGDGPLRKEIEKKVKQYGLEKRIKFTGNINNVNEYLNAIDMIVMPSLFEGLPLSLMEQQANGLQCVVSDAITEEVDKTGNLLFLPLSMSAKEWAERITTFKDEYTREERSKYAIASICASGYSIKEEAQKLKSLYLGLQ